MIKLSVLHDSKKTTAVIIFFVLTSTLITFEVYSAQSAPETTIVVYYDFPSYGIVGQSREILIQISPNPPTGGYLYNQLEMTAPDGLPIQLWALASNATGFVSFQYTPSTVGTYYINNFYFPGVNTTLDIYSQAANNYTALNASILQPWVVSTIQDLTPPTGSIVINNNTVSTSNILVNLNLSANDDLSKVKSMRFSNDGTSWSSWEPYTVFTPSPTYITTKAWNLTSGNGVKTVYAQFMDEAGLTSNIYSDNITLNAVLASSSISCFLTTATLKVGENTTISGYLTPALSGTNIQIQGSVNGAAWSTLATVALNAGGGYSFNWFPTVNGTWTIKAIWAGDTNTAPCESTPLQLQVNFTEVGPGTSSTSFDIAILIAASIITVIIIGAAYVLYLLKQRSTQNLLTKVIDSCIEKLNKDLEEEKYEQCLVDLNDLIEKTQGLTSSSKPFCEINKPPYSVSHNLKDIKKTLSEKPSEETMTEFLEESEIKPYLLGLSCVFNTFRNLKSLKPIRRGDSPSRFFVPMVSRESGLFDNVNQRDKLNPNIKDFFFTWINVEVEPIRIYLDGGKIFRARSRWHWRHIDISRPYVDEKGRIEVLILPHFHTPIIRRSKNDICFEVFAKCFFAIVGDYKLVFNQQVDPKVTSPGRKDSHPPAEDYNGWDIPFGQPSIKGEVGI